MCRNIKPLYNFEPATTDEEIRAAAIQFVRKISGFNKPSAANTKAFETAVEAVTAASQKLLESLNTTARRETAKPCKSGRRTSAAGSGSTAQKTRKSRISF